MHEAAGTVEVALEDLLARLQVEVAEVVEHIGVVMRLLHLLHLENGLELTEAVEPKLLREAHDGRARDAAGAREFMDGNMASGRTMLQDVLPDDHIRVVQSLAVGIDEFVETHKGVLHLTCKQGKSEQAERLQQKNPAEDREARQRARVNDAVARELRVAVHLLRHGKAGDSTRRGEDGDERHELDAAEAQEDCQPQHNGRHDDETGEHTAHELRQMIVEAAPLEEAPRMMRATGVVAAATWPIGLSTGFGMGIPRIRKAAPKIAPRIIGFLSTPRRMPGR